MADIDYGEFSSLVPGAKQTEQSQYGEFSTLVPKTSAMDDLATSAKKGVVGVGEAVVGVADLTSGGRAGKALQDAGLDLKGTQQSLSDNYSPEMKRQQQYVGEAQGFWDAARRAATSPRFAANAIVESIPSMVAGGVAGRGMQALGAGRAVASGMGEGLVMAGQHAEQNRQNNAQGLLDEKGYTESAIAGVGGAIIGALPAASSTTRWACGTRTACSSRAPARPSRARCCRASARAPPSRPARKPASRTSSRWARTTPRQAADRGRGRAGRCRRALSAASWARPAASMPGHHAVSANRQQDDPQSKQNDPAATAPVGPAQAAAEVAKASGAVQGAQASGADPGAPQAPMGGVRGLIAEAAKRNGVDPTHRADHLGHRDRRPVQRGRGQPQVVGARRVPVHGRHPQDVPRGHARAVARPGGAGRVRRQVHRRRPTPG
jgi:hypothetical protein